jgi:hypothetical protein
MRNNSISSIYLSKYDLINKLSISNINKCPKIEKITLQFSLKDFNKNNKLEGLSTDAEMNNQIKGILMLYILFGINSTIQYHSEKNVVDNFSKKNIHSYYIQKMTIENQLDINKFLNFLFIENDFKSFTKTSTLKKSKNGQSSLSLSTTIPLSVFNDLTEFCNFSAKDISAKELNLHISFVINNADELKDAHIYSLSPFWHFG